MSQHQGVQRSDAAAILAVDDDPTALVMMQALLSRLGYQVVTATGGNQALEALRAQPIAAILLDREMPGMNGIDTVRAIKADDSLTSVPIIMVTGSNDPAQVREGIEAGVFYYLEKPADAQLLSSVVSAALRQASERTVLSSGENSTRGFDLTDIVKFRFRTLEDAIALSGFVANYFPDPNRALDGAAALLFNAVEHGLCRLGFEAKGAALQNGTLETEVAQRLTKLPPESCATASVARRDGGVVLAVSDPGPGFDWRQYTDLDVNRSGATHGRGIMRAKTLAFDELRFNAKGNQVLGLMRDQEEFEW